MGEQEQDGAGIDPRVLRSSAESRTELDPEARKALRGLNRASRRSGRLSPRRYNLTIGHEHRFVWFRVAKAGTRTILGHLVDSGVDLDVSHAMRIRYPTESFDDYYRFAFVRHPLDRFVSAWRDKVVDNNYYGFEPEELARLQSLDAFTRWVAGLDLTDVSTVDQHLVLQTRAIDLTQVDHLGRLETFEADFGVVCRRLGLPERVQRSRNVSTARTASAPPLITDEVRATVGDLYRLDFQILGYDVETHPQG